MDRHSGILKADLPKTSAQALLKLEQVKANISRLFASEAPPVGRAAARLDYLLDLELKLQSLGEIA